MSVNIKTLKDIRSFLAMELRDIYPVNEIKAITNIIIKTKTGITKLHQLYNDNQMVTPEQVSEIVKICKELKTGKPIQYIVGETDFYDCVIRVNSSTLIPRPETEELVDIIIKENKNFAGKILDIGTGSGCIAIALAAKIKGSVVTGIDISDDALITARENALINNVDVSFIRGDIFSLNQDEGVSADIIVSNPPYVLESEKIFMNKNVLDYEPPGALFVPDNDPLKFYRQILKTAEAVLNRRGRIYFEINETMGEAMTELLSFFGYSSIEILKDLNRRDRIAKGIKNV